MLTARLEIRLAVEADRERFVQLFCDPLFMVFSGGALDEEAANRRFDKMVLLGAELPFAKQPLVERATGRIIGYSGVDRFEFEGTQRLEFGYRLMPGARGNGYATEAGKAVLAKVAETFHGELLAIIDPTNEASKNVARKLGFEFWKRAVVNGYLDNLYRLQIDSRPVGWDSPPLGPGPLQ